MKYKCRLVMISSIQNYYTQISPQFVVGNIKDTFLALSPGACSIKLKLRIRESGVEKKSFM